MIVSIGETFYMALPKGTLIDSKHATIPGGGHVILAPVQHCDSLYAVSADERQSLVDELKKYRDGLTAFYQKYQMVPVVFEVVRPRSNYHMFIQVVPLTQDQLNTLEDVVAAIAEEQEIKFTDALPVSNSHSPITRAHSPVRRTPRPIILDWNCLMAVCLCTSTCLELDSIYN
jgi:diadenosine tetraphosphate (Ap4A) HIT family hydrolase